MKAGIVKHSDGAEETRGAGGGRRGPSSLFGAATIAAFVAAGCAGGAHASRVQVLMSFGGLRGSTSMATPAVDASGNIYVTGTIGGAHGDGAVVQLQPPRKGRTAWTRTVIHTFKGGNGELPDTSLLVDRAGNLYGGTEFGRRGGCGLIYELTPPAQGRRLWKQTVLHEFNQNDGCTPQAGLIADAAGNLYGTTNEGGKTGDCEHTFGCGVVFELSPPPPGRRAWTASVLHHFHGKDGSIPAGRLVADAAGNLYGTAAGDADDRDGVVYELSPPPAGQKGWTETVIHAFDGADGEEPVASLALDGAGNLYGTAWGGPRGEGVVFELSPPDAGQTAWKETVLRAFRGRGGVGCYAGVIADAAGDLFGMTDSGGKFGDGAVFELSPPAIGQTRWTETVLHEFDGAHGKTPLGGLMMDAAGILYGTTEAGGRQDAGVVFELTR